MMALDQQGTSGEEFARRNGNGNGEGDIRANGADQHHLVFSPKDPLPTAQAFVTIHYQHDAGRTLHHHRGAFYSWNSTSCVGQ